MKLPLNLGLSAFVSKLELPAMGLQDKVEKHEFVSDDVGSRSSESAAQFVPIRMRWAEKHRLGKSVSS